MKERVLWNINKDAKPVAVYASFDELLNGMRCVPINNPVIATVWTGSYTSLPAVDTIITPSTVADIVYQVMPQGPNVGAPWLVNKWLIDDDGDLRYTGVNHAGVNTAIFRELKTKNVPDISLAEMRYINSVYLGRRILKAIGQ